MKRENVIFFFRIFTRTYSFGKFCRHQDGNGIVKIDGRGILVGPRKTTTTTNDDDDDDFPFQLL